jgi:hypothetical protein
MIIQDGPGKTMMDAAGNIRGDKNNTQVNETPQIRLFPVNPRSKNNLLTNQTNKKPGI